VRRSLGFASAAAAGAYWVTGTGAPIAGQPPIGVISRSNDVSHDHQDMDRVDDADTVHVALNRCCNREGRSMLTNGDPEGIRTPDLHRDKVAC
jgi:hypothetical protein